MQNALRNARLLSKALEGSGWYTCESGIHHKCGTWEKLKEKTVGGEHDAAMLYNPGLPVVAFRFSDTFRKEFPRVKQQSVSTLLRVKGYIIPSIPPSPSLPSELVLTRKTTPSLLAAKISRFSASWCARA